MDFSSSRTDMVERQVRRRGVRDERVLGALRAVERHRFVPLQARELAYEDHPLAIGHGQTISQPFMVAFMTEALRLSGGERVLEIGSGSGYQAAILAELGCRVTTMERLPALAALARTNLVEAGYRDVVVLEGDGTQGWPPDAPYDRILVTAGGPEIPSSLVAQLAVGGILLMPVGARWLQELTRIVRDVSGDHAETILSCVFVPLIGAEGWKETP